MRGFSEGFKQPKKDRKDSLSFLDKAKLIPSNIKSGVSILLDGKTVNGTLTMADFGYTAGEVIIASSLNAVALSSPQSPTKMKEFRINKKGVYRIKYRVATSGNSTFHMTAQVYKNGVAIGATRYVYDYYINSSDDISCEVNDLLQVYGCIGTGQYVITVDNCTVSIGGITVPTVLV